MNTKLLREQADKIDQLRKEHDKFIDSRNAVLAVNCGQNTASMSIAGVAVSITTLNNCYMPAVVKSREMIQAECAKILQANIDTLNSKITGAENELRRMMQSKVD